MQRTVLIFRTLIVASIVLAIVGTVIDSLIPNLLPEILNDAWESYVSEDPPWILIAIAGGLALIVLVAGLVATIGLLMLKRWARPLALWTTVLSVLAYPLMGAQLYSGWALMLIDTSMMIWGAALAMAYYSEIKTHFEA